MFRSFGTRLKMSTSDHTETDGQTERVNRVLKEILHGYVHSFSSWSEFLPMVEFAINNSVHASAEHTTFFVSGLRHPRIPTLLECDYWIRGGLARVNTVLALAHHAPTLTSSRMMPTLKKIISIITMRLLANPMMMTVLVFSASPMTKN